VLNQSNDGVGGADYSDNTQFGAGDSLTFTGASASDFATDNTGVICFAAQTQIQTPRGQVPIGEIRIGDLVDTLDNGPQRVRWIGRRHVSAGELRANPRLRPIRIKPGVLGNARALIVSRQHGLLWGREGAELVRAIKLVKPCAGIHIAHGRAHVTYVHLLFDRHQILIAEGIPAESFYPGRMALKALDRCTLRSFERHFGLIGALAGPSRHVIDAFGPTARPFRVEANGSPQLKHSGVMRSHSGRLC